MDTRRGRLPTAFRRRLATPEPLAIVRRSSDDPKPPRGSGAGAAARRLLRGCALGRAHLSRSRRIPDRAGARTNPRCLHRPSGAPRAATWLVPRKAERELSPARAPSGPRLRDADRQPPSKSRRGLTRAGSRDRRWKPALHRTARRHARRTGRSRGRAPDPPDDCGVVVGAPRSPRTRRAGRDNPRRRRRQGVFHRCGG